MRHTLVAIVFHLAGPLIAGEPPAIAVADPTPPAKWVELKGRPNRAVRLTASVPVRWALIDDVTADLIPDPDMKAATFVGPKGQFKIVGISIPDPTKPDAATLEVVRYLVTNDGDDNTPPGPGPKPPAPPPGPPVDPLVAEFKTAYTSDPGAAADKAAVLAMLVELYDQAQGIAGNANITTAKALSAKVIETSHTLAEKIKANGLNDLRNLIAAKIKAVFPFDATLTDDARKAAKDLFAHIHDALLEAGK
jgi:hypothetical protein